ncbi:MAG: ribbon-helix-helix protein, CopG family [Candidatus Nanosalina sp.]
MAIGVRLPEEQEKEVERVVEEENYPSKSEFVREALRNELRERMERKELQEVKKRKKEVKNGDKELESHEEVMKKADLED